MCVCECALRICIRQTYTLEYNNTLKEIDTTTSMYNTHMSIIYYIHILYWLINVKRNNILCFFFFQISFDLRQLVYNIFLYTTYLYMRWFFTMIIYFFFSFGKHSCGRTREKFHRTHPQPRVIARKFREKSNNNILRSGYNFHTPHDCVRIRKYNVSIIFEGTNPPVQVCKTRLGNVFRRPRRRFIISFELDTIDIRPRRSRSARQRQRLFSCSPSPPRSTVCAVP